MKPKLIFTGSRDQDMEIFGGPLFCLPLLVTIPVRDGQSDNNLTVESAGFMGALDGELKGTTLREDC